MALDLPLPNDANRVIVHTTSTTLTRVQSVVFDFDNTCATAFIAFGDNNAEGTFNLKGTESWNLSGMFYYASISTIPQGNTIAEALLNSVANIIIQIQSDAALKQSLLDNGQLVIR